MRLMREAGRLSREAVKAAIADVLAGDEIDEQLEQQVKLNRLWKPMEKGSEHAD